MRVNWWPWNGNNVVVKNYINDNGYYRPWSGSFFNQYSGCCQPYGGSSFMNQMLAFGFLNSILASIRNSFTSNNQPQYVPPYQYMPTMYPGLYLQNRDGAGGLDITNENSDDAIKKRLLLTQYKVVDTLSDNTVLAVDKNGKLVKAASLDELIEKAMNNTASEENEDDGVDGPEENRTTSNRASDDGLEEGTVANREPDNTAPTEPTESTTRRGLPENLGRAENDISSLMGNINREPNASSAATTNTVSSAPVTKKFGNHISGIRVYGTTYSEGIKFPNGNILYKDQEGSWSKNDRDAIWVIDNNSYKMIYGVGSEADFGEIVGKSDFPRSDNGKFQLISINDDGQAQFRKGKNFQTTAVFKLDGNGPLKNHIIFVENGTVMIKSPDGKQKFPMEDIMFGTKKFNYS